MSGQPDSDAISGAKPQDGSGSSRLIAVEAFPRAGRGFTLLELIVTLAVVALMAAVVVGVMGGVGVGARQRAALDGIVAGLSRARLSAMQRQERVEAQLFASVASGAAGADGEAAADTIELRVGERVASWGRTGLVPTPGVDEGARATGGVSREGAGSGRVVDELAHAGRVGALKVVFDSSGRADRALWRLAESASGSTGGTGADGPLGRTLWLVRFDVVSGVPTAERVRTRP
ncbi:MAG: prepilin-type N-terminal cleavage/methylation domain-containing protein [Phycisphaerales bacterium]